MTTHQQQTPAQTGRQENHRPVPDPAAAAVVPLRKNTWPVGDPTGSLPSAARGDRGPRAKRTWRLVGDPVGSPTLERSAVDALLPAPADNDVRPPRRRRFAFKPTTADDGAPGADGRLDVPLPQGPKVRRGTLRIRDGWYAPLVSPAPTTTRQGEILNPALIGEPTDAEGVPIGRDMLSGAPVAHDPFTAYATKQITSPSVLVIGIIGSGKSSLLKTAYVLRPLALKARRCVVVDRKDRDGEGEYSELTRRYKGALFQMRIGGGGTRLNPLDPQILAALGASGQFGLLKAIADRANDGAALDPKWEKEALRVAYRRALGEAEAASRAPVLADVTGALGVVDGVEAWASYSPAARDRMHQAGLSVKHLLNGVVADELEGLFDGPTSREVSLSSRMTSFDISQLPKDGPATALVQAVAHAWLLGTLRKERGMGTNFLAEEGWEMVSGPVAEQMNANQMLARGLGLSNVVAIHHLSQIPGGSAALSMVKEPQTLHLYRQDRLEDREACARFFDLDETATEKLGNLDQGEHLMKVGLRPPMHVQHVRSSLEEVLTETDSAMLRETPSGAAPLGETAEVPA